MARPQMLKQHALKYLEAGFLLDRYTLASIAQGRVGTAGKTLHAMHEEGLIRIYSYSKHETAPKGKHFAVFCLADGKPDANYDSVMTSWRKSKQAEAAVRRKEKALAKYSKPHPIPTPHIGIWGL